MLFHYWCHALCAFARFFFCTEEGISSNINEMFTAWLLTLPLSCIPRWSQTCSMWIPSDPSWIGPSTLIVLWLKVQQCRSNSYSCFDFFGTPSRFESVIFLKLSRIPQRFHAPTSSETRAQWYGRSPERTVRSIAPFFHTFYPLSACTKMAVAGIVMIGG